MTETLPDTATRPRGAGINPDLARTQGSPIMEVARWVHETEIPPDRPLIDLSQAAPRQAPPAALRQAMARAVAAEGAGHLYGPVLGNDDLRAEIAARWSGVYGGRVAADEVAVTAGCNQAFCTAVATACAPGDQVILPVPWYFNHKMWLDMSGIETLPLPVGDDLLPSPEAARRLIGPKTRAIALVTPNNPTGREYPPALLGAFFDLAAERGLLLIVDETYRDFLGHDGAPHGLFQRPDWGETLAHLYSFSKVFRITGHRTGALITGAGRIAAAEKVLDTVTICPAQTGQIAALEGLRALGPWVAAQRAEIRARAAALARLMAADAPAWQVHAIGAYFAWITPPWDAPARETARRLLAERSLLMLPGEMFLPEDTPTRRLRMAFANTDEAGLAEAVRRLGALTP